MLILEILTIRIPISPKKLGVTPKLMPSIIDLLNRWPISKEVIPIRYLECVIVMHHICLKTELLTRPSVAEVSFTLTVAWCGNTAHQ